MKDVGLSLAMSRASNLPPPKIEVESLSVTENGTYTAEEGKAYNPVNVNVGVDLPSVVTFHDSDDSIFSIEAVIENKSIPMPSAIPEVPSGSTGMFTGWKDSQETMVSFPYIPNGKIDLYPDFGLPAPTSLEESSWDLIDAVCYGVDSYVASINGVKTLCYDRNGVREEWYKVGDTKNITIGPLSAPETYEFVILDFEHDTITGTSKKAKITFGMSDITLNKYALGYRYGDMCGWNQTNLYSSIISSTYLNKFINNSDLYKYIKDVDKTSRNRIDGSWSTGNLSCKIWLLSKAEVGLSDTWSTGTLYPYYSDSSKRIKTDKWWTRSEINSQYYWGGISATGTADSITKNWDTLAGICLNFCI